MPEQLKLFILESASRELRSLPKKSYFRVKEKILSLSSNPRPSGCRKLSRREGWRIRVGDLRIIYEINEPEKSITILHIGHRKDIYKRR